MWKRNEIKEGEGGRLRREVEARKVQKL